MSRTTDIDTVTRLFMEGFSRCDEAVLDEVLHPEFTLTSAGAVAGDGADKVGAIETLKAGMRHNHASFENWQFTIDHIMADADHVAARWTATGRHVGSFAGEVPTGKDVRLQGNSLYEMRDGRILKDWVFANQADFMGQLGIGAPPAPERGEALVRRFWEDVVNAHDADAIDDLMSPDYRQHADGIGQGPEGVKTFLRETFAASEGMQADVHDIVSTGEIAVSRATVRFDTPPPGWAAEQTIVDVFRTDGQRLTEHWDTR